MKNIILFDQDTQHYLQSIYRRLNQVLKKKGYNLIVVFDKNLNSINKCELFVPIEYTLNFFIKTIEIYKPVVIIQRTWLKYKFLFPFMFYARYIKGIKIITWTKGVNIFKPDQLIMNQFYYLRQYLSSALLLYDQENKKYIKVHDKKVFVAKNTLNFNDFPVIQLSKEELKVKYKFKDRQLILMVGRLNLHKRKPELFLNIQKELELHNYHVIIIGPSLPNEVSKEIESAKNIDYLGAIYDDIKMAEYFKMADLFCMPGRIGLAINQSFYYGVPVVLEDIRQGVETSILNPSNNGLYFEENNASDMFKKINIILSNDIIKESYSKNAKDTLHRKASLDRMIQGFLDAINYVENK